MTVGKVVSIVAGVAGLGLAVWLAIKGGEGGALLAPFLAAGSINFITVPIALHYGVAP